jgi:hypothetical protein
MEAFSDGSRFQSVSEGGCRERGSSGARDVGAAILSDGRPDLRRRPPFLKAITGIVAREAENPILFDSHPGQDQETKQGGGLR